MHVWRRKDTFLYSMHPPFQTIAASQTPERIHTRATPTIGQRAQASNRDRIVDHPPRPDGGTEGTEPGGSQRTRFAFFRASHGLGEREQDVRAPGLGQPAPAEDGRRPADDLGRRLSRRLFRRRAGSTHRHDDGDGEAERGADDFAVARVLVAGRARGAASAACLSPRRAAPRRPGGGGSAYVPHWKHTTGNGRQSMARAGSGGGGVDGAERGGWSRAVGRWSRAGWLGWKSGL